MTGEEQSGSNAGGFSFDLCARNTILEKRGMQAPGFLKTGTTIAGIIFKVPPHPAAPALGALRCRTG